MLKGLLLIFSHLVLVQLIISQPHPRFGTFHGTVYDMPSEYLNTGYGSWVSYFDILTHITLDSLAIPETHTRAKYFPGVPYRARYCILFSSELTIEERGCYEFYLESDDGSRLWIEDSLIIDNDGYQPMTAKRDSMMLDKGKYPVKVWYYSANESLFGLILRSEALPDTTYCMPRKPKRVFAFDANTVLFEFDSYIISPQGKLELDKICADLNNQTVSRIHVIGYTDQVGSPEYNAVLSKNRAESIVRYIKSKLIQPDIIFKSEGRGEQNSGAQNADEQYLNRRVEIYIE